MQLPLVWCPYSLTFRIHNNEPWHRDSNLEMLHQAWLWRSCRKRSFRRSSGWRKSHSRRRVASHNKAAYNFPIFTNKNLGFIIARLPSADYLATITRGIIITASSTAKRVSLKTYKLPISIPKRCPLYARQHICIRISRIDAFERILKHRLRINTFIVIELVAKH